MVRVRVRVRVCQGEEERRIDGMHVRRARGDNGWVGILCRARPSKAARRGAGRRVGE